MAIRRYMGVKKEAQYGILETSGFTWLEAVETISPDQGWIVSSSVGTRARRKANLGPWRNRGNISCGVEPENIGDFLMGLMGQDQVQNMGGGIYAHTFSPADSIPSYSVLVGLDEITQRQLAGCLVNNISLKCTQGEEMKITVGILQAATLETTGAVVSSTLSTLDPFVFHEAAIQLAGSTITTQIYDCEIRVDNGLIDKGALGTRYVPTIRPGLRVVNGKISMFFSDTTEYQRFLNGTEFSLTVRYISGDYRIEVYLPRCIYKSGLVPHAVAMTEPVVLDGDFEVLYSDSSQYDIRIILRNTKSTAY